MEKIIVNFDNLRTEDINEKIYRPRAIMINSDKEILLGFCDNTFQFPGGFLEQNETLIEGLRREILEETGISLDNGEIIKLFCTIQYLNKDYPKKKINRLTEFDYYYVKTDYKINPDNTNYDKWEKEKNFQLKYVPINDFEQVLLDTINDNLMNKMIYKDMIKVFNLIKEEL